MSCQFKPCGSVHSLLKYIITNECGATAIEYALMASAIGVALAATVFGLGSKLKTNFYDAVLAMF